ncbi:MAG: hypothetical protein NTW52_16900 [Planctomycetota bacterium]|nr:hypothetical protein [Planctomycetota bacterium]
MNLDNSKTSTDHASQPATPFAKSQSSGFQFSMGSLLVIMLLVSVMSASLLWASRLPMVTDEIHILLGTTPATNNDGTDRGAQLVFLLFCYAAPLLMAGLLHSWLMIFRLFQTRFRSTSELEEDL